MLSNSNPKNVKENDTFFEKIYKGFYINEIFAKRMINSNAKGRGQISELLITNYEEQEEWNIEENSNVFFASKQRRWMKSTLKCQEILIVPLLF